MPAPVGRLGCVSIDARDIVRLARFYTDLAGWQPVKQDPEWITLLTGDGQEVAFQLAPDHRPSRWPGQQMPQQLHLDLQVADPEAAALRAEALGATRLADGPSWITLADPAGHPFDLCRAPEAGEATLLHAATFDAPDAVGLARFYAHLLGMELIHQGPVGAMISGSGRRLLFQQVEDYRPPRWLDPEHPQQAHLDIDVDDPDGAEQVALSLGARRLDGGGERFRVFADPAGHPFCLTY